MNLPSVRSLVLLGVAAAGTFPLLACASAGESAGPAGAVSYLPSPELKRKRLSTCLDDPLNVDACIWTLEWNRDYDDADVTAAQARVAADDQILCKGSDAEVTALVTGMLAKDPELKAKLTLPEAVAYGRARSCLYLGATALGLGGTEISGRVIIHGDLPLPVGADVERAVGLVAKSCDELPRLTAKPDLYSYREPGIAACIILGDAYALGVVTYDLPKATAAYGAACKRGENRNNDIRQSCMAVDTTVLKESCSHTQAGCRLKSSLSSFESPVPVVLRKAIWADLGAARVREGDALALRAGRRAGDVAAPTAHKRHVDELAARLATLEPAAMLSVFASDLLKEVMPAENIRSSKDWKLDRAERAWVSAPVLVPVVQAAIARVAKEQSYASIGSVTSLLLDLLPAEDAAWSELRDALARFRVEAGAHFSRKGERAKRQPATVAVCSALAERFGVKPTADSTAAQRRFGEATRVVVDLAAVKSPCAFLSPQGAPRLESGLRAVATLDLDTCDERETLKTTLEDYTFDTTVDGLQTPEKHKEHRSFTRTVPDCHMVYTQTCTGKESFSCYTSGSRKECSGTRTETYEADVEVTSPKETRQVKQTGQRSVERHVAVLDLAGRVTASLGRHRVTVPFMFAKTLEAGSFLPHEAAARDALRTTLANDVGANLRTKLGEEALASADAAAAAGRADDAENARWMAVAFGLRSPALSTWLHKVWGLDHEDAGVLVVEASR